MSTTCGSALAPGASCTLTLQFKPSELYTDDASLLIADNAAGSPQPIYIGGFGATSGGTPTIAIKSSQNPSAAGQPVTFTATVAGTTSGTPVPTGTVAFYNSVNPLGTIHLNAGGQATVTTTSLGTGSQTISAIYSGDNNYASVSSLVLTEVVNPASNTPTTTTLISSVNPSASGQLVIFTATIAGEWNQHHHSHRHRHLHGRRQRSRHRNYERRGASAVFYIPRRNQWARTPSPRSTRAMVATQARPRRRSPRSSTSPPRPQRRHR